MRRISRASVCPLACALSHKLLSYVSCAPALTHTHTQDLESEHNTKKAAYDAAMSQYDSRVATLEQEVSERVCVGVYMCTCVHERVCVPAANHV